MIVKLSVALRSPTQLKMLGCVQKNSTYVLLVKGIKVHGAMLPRLSYGMALTKALSHYYNAAFLQGQHVPLYY